MERLYSYKMTHDTRFAPNPLFGVLTLATCKPRLRKYAKVGDWISGWTSQRIAHNPTPVGEEKLIYLARVSEKLTFAEYWEKYPEKQPVFTYDKDVLERFGDNIYKPVEGGFEQIRNIDHNAGDMARDLSGEYVLLCKEFYYFSCINPLEIPQELKPKLPKGAHPTGYLTKNPEKFIRFVIEHRNECYRPEYHENHIQQERL